MPDRRHAAVLTTGRQDYSILRSTLLLLHNSPDFELQLLIGGMHLSQVYGMTVRNIEANGLAATERLDWINADKESTVTSEAGRAVEMCGAALRRLQPEFLLLVGDRYETISAALAATLQCVPIVHLHGGEETEGAFDNMLRHALTKLSHLHFVSHADYAARVLQMGEDPAAIHVVGSPGLDNLFRTDLPTRDDLEHLLGIRFDPPVVLVSAHPTTLAPDTSGELEAIVSTMERVPATYVISLPNSDPGNQLIRARLHQFASGRRDVAIAEALGDRCFPAVLHLADAMLGNSSSAVIEAPAIGLPSVNVGDRQKGRRMGPSVISVAGSADAVEEALRRALTTEFRRMVKPEPSPQCDGKVGQRIVSILRNWQPPRPPVKRFHETKLRCPQN